MASTEAGRLLTEQHRQSQLQVRARALRDYLRLWPMWEGDDASFAQMAAATVVLVRAFNSLSANLSGSYFQSFRLAEQAPGEAAIRLAGPIDADKVVAGLTATGRNAVRDALLAGRSADDARVVALTRTSGSVTRHVLNGGRETILRSVSEDKEARGWARVTDGDPCAFCALLASRGPVYKDITVDFQAHDECGCSAEPVYGRSEWPGRAREFHDLYNEAIHEANEADELHRGTSNDLFNAFRRRYERERAAI
jgi:hypothetical protein